MPLINRSLGILFVITLLAVSPAAYADVAIEWVTVRDAGNDGDDDDPANPCDPQVSHCFGAVSTTYRISKFEITNAQYTEFLNAVGATDTFGLYYFKMASGFGGISRSGSPGSYSYSTIAGQENKPVLFVSFWDASRFANWLHNGQPTGAQDETSTEDGAYTLTGFNPINEWVWRESGAQFFVPNEHEWYKAAYYKGGGLDAGYWDFPYGADTQTTCTAPGAILNTANCGSVHGDIADVGSYTGSVSPSGTFDQGGNVREWTEAREDFVTEYWRISRGGDFNGSVVWLDSGRRGDLPPWYVDGSDYVGFRIAGLAPPLLVPSLGPAGLILVCGLLGAVGRWRLRH